MYFLTLELFNSSYYPAMDWWCMARSVHAIAAESSQIWAAAKCRVDKKRVGALRNHRVCHNFDANDQFYHQLVHFQLSHNSFRSQNLSAPHLLHPQFSFPERVISWKKQRGHFFPNKLHCCLFRNFFRIEAQTI